MKSKTNVLSIGLIVLLALALGGCSRTISAEDKTTALSQCQAAFASDSKTSPTKMQSITYSLVTFGVLVNKGFDDDFMGTVNLYSLALLGVPAFRTFSLDFMGTVKSADNAETKNVDYNCKFLHQLGGPVRLYWNMRSS